MKLVERLDPDGSGRRQVGRCPLLAGGIAALEPYSAATSALILSEALFVPLMLGMLWGLATLWRGRESMASRTWPVVALATGIAAGAGVLVRPSWALFVPAVLAAWVVLAGRGRRGLALKGAAVVALGVVVVLGPGGSRNARIYGRFVPTALWMGASLYDGLRPDADGSSDMRFLDDPAIRRLDEVTQDAALRDAALRFARNHPGRVLELATIKAARFWSPWPNADQFASVPGQPGERGGDGSAVCLDPSGVVGPPAGRAGAGAAGGSAPVFRGVAPGLRQLDPLSHPGGRAGVRAGGFRADVGRSGKSLDIMIR